MKIGVMVESFRCGLDGGLRAAAELGADGVQLYATGGETHPDVLKGAARGALRRRLASLNLELAALCADFGGHGFEVAAENTKRIADSRKVLDLAVELGCRVATTHIGVIPADSRHARYLVLARACEQMARAAAAAGGAFAIETGPEPAAVLRAFLDDLDAGPGLKVNFDPANLVMVCRDNIPEAVAALGPFIVHTHAKDGVNLRPVDAEKLYGSFVEPEPDFKAADFIAEVPLGRGQVPFDAYLAALRRAGYDGYLTIEREVGANPRADIAAAVDFLRGKLSAS